MPTQPEKVKEFKIKNITIDQWLMGAFVLYVTLVCAGNYKLVTTVGWPDIIFIKPQGSDGSQTVLGQLIVDAEPSYMYAHPENQYNNSPLPGKLMITKKDGYIVAAIINVDSGVFYLNIGRDGKGSGLYNTIGKDGRAKLESGISVQVDYVTNQRCYGVIHTTDGTLYGSFHFNGY